MCKCAVHHCDNGEYSASAGLLQLQSVQPRQQQQQQQRISWMQHLHTGMERFTKTKFKPFGFTASACICTHMKYLTLARPCLAIMEHQFESSIFHSVHTASLLENISKPCLKNSSLFPFQTVIFCTLHFVKSPSHAVNICTMFTVVYTASLFSFPFKYFFY